MEPGDTDFKIAIWELSKQTTKCPLTQEGGNQLDQIFFVHQSIPMIVERNAKKLHKVDKKLGEMTKVQKRVVTNTFLRKL